MTEEKENENELLKQFDGLKKTVCELNDKIERMEKQSHAGADDQIFLGALLTFITVFLTLQYGDIANFFQSVNSATAVYSAIMLEVSSIVFLVVAIGLRYWATLVDGSKLSAIAVGRFCFWYNSSVLRYGSLESLITCFILVIVIVTLNIIQIVPVLLVETLLSFFVASVILAFGRLENKILLLYKRKNLIPLNSIPFARTAFSGTAFFVSGVAFLLAIINLLIVLIEPRQFYPFNHLILNYVPDITIFWASLQRLVSVLLFITGAVLFYKAALRHYYINSPTQEIRIKTRLRRKRKKILGMLVKRAVKLKKVKKT